MKAELHRRSGDTMRAIASTYPVDMIHDGGAWLTIILNPSCGRCTADEATIHGLTPAQIVALGESIAEQGRRLGGEDALDDDVVDLGADPLCACGQQPQFGQDECESCAVTAVKVGVPS